MSPQPKQSVPQAGDHNEFVHALLLQAQSLSDELRGPGGLHERIGANRDTLRNIKTTGLLSDEQSKAIDEFYPPRKRGEKDDDTPANPTA